MTLKCQMCWKWFSADTKDMNVRIDGVICLDCANGRTESKLSRIMRECDELIAEYSGKRADTRLFAERNGYAKISKNPVPYYNQPQPRIFEICKECHIKLTIPESRKFGFCCLCWAMMQAIVEAPGLFAAHTVWESENKKRAALKQRLMED